MLIRMNEQVVSELAPQTVILNISDILQYTVTTATNLKGLTCWFATKTMLNMKRSAFVCLFAFFFIS